MRIMSWNVNGLRAVYKKGAIQSVLDMGLDIICLQETKSQPEQLPNDLLDLDQYQAVFSSSETKKGYSGVATYTNVDAGDIEYGFGVPEFDQEGRIVKTDISPSIALLNIYFPNGKQSPERLNYKMRFYEATLDYIERLKQQGQLTILCGDVNTAHFPIDLARPKENEHSSGFLPIERAWIDKLLSTGYVDIFRHHHPEQADAYTWWDMKTGARARNVGWRIDYFFVPIGLMEKTVNSMIHPDIMGSDHCPISIELTL